MRHLILIFSLLTTFVVQAEENLKAIYLPPAPLIAGNPVSANPAEFTNFPGEHIDPFSGVVTLFRNDVSVPATGGLNIAINRYYIAGHHRPGFEGDLEYKNYLEHAWQLHAGYVTKIVQCPSQYSRCNPVLVHDNGSAEALVPGGGGYILKSNAVASMSDDGFNIKDTEGVKYRYAQKVKVNDYEYRYYLTKVTDRFANTLSYAYEDKTHLTKIMASDGQEVNIEYEDIEVPKGDTTIKQHVPVRIIHDGDALVEYRYDNPTGRPLMLMSANYADGREESYFYEMVMKLKTVVLKQVKYSDGTQVEYDFETDDTQDIQGYPAIRFSSKTAIYADGSRDDWSMDTMQISGDIDDEQRTLRQVVHTPDNDIEYVFSFQSKDNVWMHGNLLHKSVFDKGTGKLAQEQTWEFEKVQIATQEANHTINYFGDLSRDDHTYKPLLKKTIISQDGVTYATTYDDYDNYHNPGTIVQSSGKYTRTAALTYHLDSTHNDTSKIKTKTINGKLVLENEYESHGVVKRASKYGVNTHYAYTAKGDLAETKDAQLRWTRYANHKFGTPQNIDVYGMQQTEQEVNNKGLVTKSTNILGQTVSDNYDRYGRERSHTPATGSTTTTEYNSNKKTVTVDNFKQVTIYNFRAKPLQVAEYDTSSGESRVVDYQYNAIGQPVFVSNAHPAGEPTTLGQYHYYDGIGREVKTCYPTNSVCTKHDYNGLDVVTTNVKQQKTTRSYSGYGAPGDGDIVAINEPGSSTTINRDNWGYVTSVNHNGVVRSFTYNDKYFVATETNPETGVIAYPSYDATGNPFKKVDAAGEVINYTYDRMGQLKTVTGDNITSKAYHYDELGNVKSIDHGASTTRYEYDDNNVLKTEHIPHEGVFGASEYNTVTYIRNGKGDLDKVIYPDGESVGYNPNAWGESQQVGSLISQIKYAPSGQWQSMQYSNGAQASAHYFDDNRVSQMRFSGNGFAYTYDALGNLTTQTNLKHAEQNLTLTYDALQRVDTAAGPWGGTFKYAYTANDDVQSVTLNGNPYLSLNYDANHRLQQSNDDVFVTKANGFITQRADDSYAFTTDGDLNKHNDTEIHYDAEHQPLSYSNAQSSGYSVTNQAGHVLVEYDANNKVSKKYYYFQDIPVAVKTADTLEYLYFDRLGSVFATADQSNNILSETWYEPYGKRHTTGDTVNNLWYIGKAEDKATGYLTLGERYYDPMLGRFIGPDRVGFDFEMPLSMNRYNYSQNNPYYFKDPTGQFSWDNWYFGIGYGPGWSVMGGFGLDYGGANFGYDFSSSFNNYNWNFNDNYFERSLEVFNSPWNNFKKGLYDSLNENVFFGVNAGVAEGHGFGAKVSTSTNLNGDMTNSYDYLKGNGYPRGFFISGTPIKVGQIDGAYQSATFCLVTCINSKWDYQGNITVSTSFVFPPPKATFNVSGGYADKLRKP